MQKFASAGKSLQDQFGLEQPGRLKRNLGRAALIEAAIKRGEGQLAATGAFVTETGQHTGRSPKDKFIVRDALSEARVWWENIASMTPKQFKTLHEDMIAHAASKELFVQDLYGGADSDHRIKVRVYTEYAWHSLFIQTLLIEPPAKERENFVPDMTIVDLPSFSATPGRHGCKGKTIIGCDFTNGIVLIGGTSYAGEMKKSVFSYLNYILPEKGVMPMHCSANEAHGGGNTAVFFGLSGTGKTTLSADASRTLIGDDEHGWSKNGIFNFEGGCYAKTIRLSPKAEPEISEAVNRFGAILENVILDPETRLPDFDDGSLTENTRGAYKIGFISNASDTGRSGHPENIVFLTADAFGVMPPIAKLTSAQAMYHFISGYTARVAGTEEGVTEPQAAFSICFGGPFMALHASEYGNLLRKLIAQHDVDCWLVNTGWTGGKAGIGHRMPIKATRTLLNAALSGVLRDVKMRKDPIFGFEVPAEVPGVETKILNPRETWPDRAAYDAQAKELVGMFEKNFAKFEKGVDPEVLAAGPVARGGEEAKRSWRATTGSPMSEFIASRAFYIRLGPKGCWEAESLRDSVLRLGYGMSPHDLCLAGDWRGVWTAMEEIRGNAGTATADVNQIRAFYEADENTIFITFVGGLLCWCRPSGPVERREDGSRSRSTLDGWRSRSMGGDVLSTDRLSDDLLKLRMFRRTICNVKAMDALLRVLRYPAGSQK